jgi:SNF2 family DNA or RNA helicase
MEICREGKYFTIQGFNALDLDVYPELIKLGFSYNPAKAEVCALYTESILYDLIELTTNEEFFDFAFAPDLLQFTIPTTLYNNVVPFSPPSLRKPRSHQEIGCRLLLEYPRFMLAWEPGAGKSKPTCDMATYFINNMQADHAIVISDASVVDTWVEGHIPKDTEYRGVSLIGSAGERRQKLRAAMHDPNVRFFVTNYEGVSVLYEELYALATPDTILILDESQRIKDMQTTRFNKIAAIAKQKKLKRVWELTGTPLTQHPEDIFTQYYLIDTSLFGTSFAAFKGLYIINNPNNKHHVIGYKNMGQYMRKLHRRCHRVRKEDVLDLPPITYEIVEFELPPKRRKLYDDFINSNGLIVHPDTGKTVYVAENRLAIMQKAQTLTKGWVYDSWDNRNPDKDLDVNPDEVINFFPDESDPRLEWLVTYLLEQQLPALVFFTHRADKPMIHTAFNRKHLTYVTIDGSVPIKFRQDLINKFRAAGADNFIAQTQAAGTGIDGLQERGQLIVYMGNIWSVEKRIQSEARIYRDGQKHKVHIVDALYKNTIDKTIYNRLMEKREFTRQLLDGTEEDFKRMLRGDIWL